MAGVNSEEFHVNPGTDEAAAVLATLNIQQEAYASCLAAVASAAVGLCIMSDKKLIFFGLIGVVVLLAHSVLAHVNDARVATEWTTGEAHRDALRELSSDDHLAFERSKAYLNNLTQEFVNDHPYRYAIAFIATAAAVTGAVLGTMMPLGESTSAESFAHFKQNVLPALPLFSAGINNLLKFANQSRALAGSTVLLGGLQRRNQRRLVRTTLQKAQNDLSIFG